ncbi:preprotein translocase subunit SecE [Clostridium tyrobutyricum]|jgi:preprotein translocase subunit SecE|uniref:Protein translocase subunit SecE n=1 Tax=Clostridium tyrobutyricum DIVETGP TaxID=1408889 RepID=W6N142_CLOTY|nr:preprotein translocase subunit SecE [Clostridium tyrobutyricum]AND86142.1 preprotein translocase subunit SecE-like protein [Clostridium tyrobutyricum]ANP70639.1 preprotein translocase subunit SecE [Clostridium tyrobutyricum]MBR9648039.1 preprotein translocase subunit SecE [Clostridium tyrobutyricum]MBV4417514.1 preprotein translocase subunit SecE [Clostridium tyrobutyricum]MBV4422189.1 preprotein translocase subunit SecE [Clostridium tyrobutyricum]
MASSNDTRRSSRNLKSDAGFFNFFKDLAGEFKIITWASKNDVKKGSISVIGFCIVYVVIVGLLDFGFNFIVQNMLK